MTKIKYLDGIRFHRALYAGAKAVIQNQAYLNKINVFPVADSDTGNNLATTMQAIIHNSKIKRSMQETMKSVADTALSGARGNSGIIFAQYLYALYKELPDKGFVSLKHFADSSKQAVKHTYAALMNPVEGTMLTVLREWTDHLVEQSQNSADYFQVITDSLITAKKSLQETPHKLKALADAGVVDAGASGFVFFLEGIVDFLQKGSIRQVHEFSYPEETSHEVHTEDPGEFRYCTEAVLCCSTASVNMVKGIIGGLGDSLILAGSEEKLHVHIHTNQPDKVFEQLFHFGDLSGIKVDDMQRQYQVSNQAKFKIGFVTDTASDLPQDLCDFYQIMQIPFGLNFGARQYLDKFTIQPERFYQMLRQDKIHPQSSQPSIATVQGMIDFALANYEKVIFNCISDKLTGIFSTASAIANKRQDSRLAVLNSRQLSVSEGLVNLRIARAIEQGDSFDDIVQQSDTWANNTRIYTDVNTLKYMVRGGRVKPLTGFIATALNLKPIVSLDDSGKALALGKSFSRRGNMKKICKMIGEQLKTNTVWEYAIVHAEAEIRAQKYGEILTKLIGKAPAYIMPLSPVVGVHNGIGTVGIGVSYDPFV